MESPKNKSQNERPFTVIEPRPSITPPIVENRSPPPPLTPEERAQLEGKAPILPEKTPAEVKTSLDVIPPATDGHSMEFSTIEFLEDAIDKKRLEILAAGNSGLEPLFSPTALKGPGKPGRVYRAVFNDPRRVSELKAQGYKITKDEEFQVGERKTTGEFVYKDTVLMDVDQQSYINRHAGYRSALDAQSQAVRQNAREKLNRILRDEGKQTSHTDHTFDDSIQGSTRNYVSDAEE